MLCSSDCVILLPLSSSFVAESCSVAAWWLHGSDGVWGGSARPQLSCAARRGRGEELDSPTQLGLDAQLNATSAS